MELKATRESHRKLMGEPGEKIIRLIEDQARYLRRAVAVAELVGIASNHAVAETLSEAGWALNDYVGEAKNLNEEMQQLYFGQPSDEVVSS